MQIGDILHQEQIKELISRLRQFGPQQYACAEWYHQDEQLQKLNMQLHVNAVMKNDEFILEECVTQDKFRMLIYDLILTASWKDNVVPLLQPHSSQLNSLKTYLALYHQTVICNILQVLMFHRTAIDESKDLLIEIIDYCYHKLTKQVAEAMRKRTMKRKGVEESIESKIKVMAERTPWEQLLQQVQQIEFSLFAMSLSILRYVTDYVKHLQIGIVHHLLVQCNIFALLVPLLEEKPWLRHNAKEEREVYEGGKWVVVPRTEYGRLPKTQAQVWIAIYNLFMDPQCRSKYELNDERKNTLLRLRKFLNEVLMDQIPALSHMLRSLEELSLMQVPTHLSMNPLIVQQVPVIAAQLRQFKWESACPDYCRRLTGSMEETQKQQINRLAELYSNSNVEGLMEGFKCAKCQKQAYKRCAKCKEMWYCSRECQVAHWVTHKPQCSAKCLAKQKNNKQTKQTNSTANHPSRDKKQNTIDQLD